MNETTNYGKESFFEKLSRMWRQAKGVFQMKMPNEPSSMIKMSAGFIRAFAPEGTLPPQKMESDGDGERRCIICDGRLGKGRVKYCSQCRPTYRSTPFTDYC